MPPTAPHQPKQYPPVPHERCLYCGAPSRLVWVHGHGQCASCGINVDECCRGEACETDTNNHGDTLS